MNIAQTARIHSTALISEDARIADNVDVGAYAVIDGNITIGPDCIIRPGAHIYGNTTIGRGNHFYTGAVIGETPQHLKYAGEPTRVEIGDGNVFREHVTVHRGTTHSFVTRIGNNNFFMASCHIAHDCVVGNRCIFANGALLGGHSIIADNVYLSGNSAVHQFIRIGRLAMLSGCSASTKDVPPFIIQQGINNICGINVVGMRRAGLCPDQINAVRQAYRIIFRKGLTLPIAMERMENEMGDVDVIQEMIAFLRNCHKGINLVRARTLDDAA